MVVKKIALKSAYIVARYSSAFDKRLKGVLLKRATDRYIALSTSKEHETNNKAVMFVSFMGRSYSDSPKALYKQMISDPAYDEWKFTWAFRRDTYIRKLAEKEILSSLKRVVPLPAHVDSYLDELLRMNMVQYRSDEHHDTLASTKYWISNSRMPDEVVPRKDQVYLQTWHGTPIKRLGADIELDKSHPTREKAELQEWYRLEARKWTYVLAQNEYGAKIMSSAFQLESLNKERNVIKSGYPRNDFLSTYNRADVDRIRTELNIPKDKKVALYAPTYRDDQHSAETGYVYDIGCNFDKLHNALGNEWVILFRAHYFVAQDFDFSKYTGFLYDVSSYDDINDLYIASDILITDYSSMLFDYTNLKKPVIFYMYDLDHYKDNVRGFYISLEELPGAIVKEEGELIDSLKHIDSYENKYREKLESFYNKHNAYDKGGTVSAKVLEKVIDKEDLSS